MKLFFGITLIFVCIEQIILNFSHHFYPMMDDLGKQSLLWFILIFAGVYLIYSAGEDKGKSFFDDEWGA